LLPAAVPILLAGCGGSAKPTAASGCKGLKTTQQATMSALLFSRQGGMMVPDVCLRFGEPQKIARHGKQVTWTYSRSNLAAVLTFERGRVVAGAWFDHSDPSATYEVTQSVSFTSQG
jgi:hypothetical protein